MILLRKGSRKEEVLMSHSYSLNVFHITGIITMVFSAIGRIRAEQRLRSFLKSDKLADDEDTGAGTDDQNQKNGNGNDAHPDFCSRGNSLNKSRVLHSMQLKCIGTVVSPFIKRIGTPRQGALVPHSRGFIDLSSKVAPMETLQGIDQYSHAWIIFQFHANTDFQGSGKTKVRPPRAHGEKIGQMATRSPHRPNAIGLSLVKVDGIDYKKKRLNISGLDLVHGTPVYGKN
jgi:tRNA-Thr(GGU) m(6)t(6)A37 methyltransferase TsaA